MYRCAKLPSHNKHTVNKREKIRSFILYCLDFQFARVVSLKGKYFYYEHIVKVVKLLLVRYKEH